MLPRMTITDRKVEAEVQIESLGGWQALKEQRRVQRLEAEEAESHPPLEEMLRKMSPPDPGTSRMGLEPKIIAVLENQAVVRSFWALVKELGRVSPVDSMTYPPKEGGSETKTKPQTEHQNASSTTS